LAENSLYVQEDPAGNIVQRIVVNTTSVPHPSWVHVRYWHVDEHDPTKRQHMEIKVMEAIASVGVDHKYVRPRHFTTDRSNFSYRLHIGYHPRGDLPYFVSPGSAYAKAKKKKVPEPVLWEWLEDLTEASLLLGTGAGLRSAAVESWKKIVHCDFKPANVFLDNPDSKIWKYYPQAIVGDFGLFVFTDENDHFNPSWYNASGGK
jgi:serine/threonine protein kinase